MTVIHSEFESVNCDVALKRLDSVWIDPLPSEPLDVELSAAWEHVQHCSNCWATFEQRRESDARVANVMQAIPVPVGLKEQLLAQTSEAPTVAQSAIALRRRAWAITTAAALLVCIASGSWLWLAHRDRPASVQILCDTTPLTSDGLSIVEDLSQLPALPQNWPQIKGLKIVGAPCWFHPAGSKAAASWMPFEFRQPKAKPIQGVLLTMLRKNVLDPPPELLVQSLLLKYAHRAGQPLSIAGWSEQGVVYLCFVSDEPAALERLMKLTIPTAA